MLRRVGVAVAVAATAGALTTAPAVAGGPPVSSGHETVTHGMLVRGAHAAGNGRPTKSKELTSHGGVIQTAPAVYVVYWGSWPATTTVGAFQVPADPNDVTQLQADFFQHVGVPASTSPGDQWSSSTTQYCNATSGTVTCAAGSTFVGQPGAVLKGVYNDPSAVPSSPTQAQIAAVAANAAAHFGGSPTINANSQIIVDTPSGHSMNGFATQWCAWHSSTSTSNASGGRLSYTYMPYIPDAGGSCGAGFENLSAASSLENSANEGVTIVGGHEYAESATDPFPNSGWLDSSGAENGDKCAWVSTSKVVSIAGVGYATQPLWSNSANNGAGGCVSAYSSSGQSA